MVLRRAGSLPRLPRLDVWILSHGYAEGFGLLKGLQRGVTHMRVVDHHAAVGDRGAARAKR